MAATETPEIDTDQDPARPIPSKAWWHRHLKPEERRRIMVDLAIIKVEHWVYRFAIMLTLSVIVAVMGLSLNSAAVVIGAMLLAPLMQPVLAAGACLSMALFTKSLIALAKVAAATTWCIAIAFVISRVLNEGALTEEVLARTQPDIKDLIVALAAGAAGAYATVREDASSSLPGVAVAVALVPPLGSVGITLELGELELARGALLLYITNLSAIVFASIVVFVVTGFVPPRRLSDNLLRLTLATVGLSALVVLVTVPLYRASIDSRESIAEQRTAIEVVEDWLGPEYGELERSVFFSGDEDQIKVELRGRRQPPDEGDLIASMKSEFPDHGVSVQWIQTQQATTTTVAPPEPTELLLAQIRTAVEDWLDESGVTYQLDRVSLNGSLVRIDAAVIGEPPINDTLLPRLAAIDETLSPVFSWSTLETVTVTTLPSRIELDLEEMQTVAQSWAAARGIQVGGVSYDGERIEVDLSGPVEPEVSRLEQDLQAVTGSDVPVSVFFTQRRLVTSTTSTTQAETPPEATVAP